MNNVIAEIQRLNKEIEKERLFILNDTGTHAELNESKSRLSSLDIDMDLVMTARAKTTKNKPYIVERKKIPRYVENHGLSNQELLSYTGATDRDFEFW